jgi:hypothetical protein
MLASYIVPPLLTAALWYLGTRAVITQPLWSRYPKPIARFMDCAACAGFWWGVVVFLVLVKCWELPVMGAYTREYEHSVIIGLCSMVWTPIVAWAHDRAMLQLGSAVDEDASDAPTNE